MKRSTHRAALSAIAILYFVALFATIAHAQPDAHGLPVNADVTPDTIDKTICVPHWTAKVRPSASFTNKIKFSKMDANGIARARSSDLELDHVISIELGGSPSDPVNLRLQWWYGDAVRTPGSADGVDSQAHVKDVLETRLRRLVCAGKLPLREAQHCIFNDWRACARAHP